MTYPNDLSEEKIVERKIVCLKCGTENINQPSHCQHCGEDLHGDANLKPDFEKRGFEYWRPFISAIIGFVGFGLFLSVEIQEFHGSPYLLSLPALPIIGLVLSWEKPLFGGFILIFSSIAAHVYLFFRSNTK